MTVRNDLRRALGALPHLTHLALSKTQICAQVLGACKSLRAIVILDSPSTKPELKTLADDPRFVMKALRTSLLARVATRRPRAIWEWRADSSEHAYIGFAGGAQWNTAGKKDNEKAEIPHAFTNNAEGVKVEFRNCRARPANIEFMEFTLIMGFGWICILETPVMSVSERRVPSRSGSSDYAATYDNNLAKQKQRDHIQFKTTERRENNLVLKETKVSSTGYTCGLPLISNIELGASAINGNVSSNAPK
ncbi:hypothetical protein DFH09DRAFT_1081555 [Mycena vulgaris]|nr:hypothetical protein DFH09DRAFT_1081555 [Mycena vulgaris]